MSTYAEKREFCAATIQQAKAVCEAARAKEPWVTGQWRGNALFGTHVSEGEGGPTLMLGDQPECRFAAFAHAALPVLLAHAEADLPSEKQCEQLDLIVQDAQPRETVGLMAIGALGALGASLNRCYATCELLAAALKEVA